MPYRIALDEAHTEGALLWQVFAAFLVAHSVLVGFILSAFSQDPVSVRGLLVGGVFGGVLCIPWYAAFSRSAAYYDFWLAVAARAEPPGIRLISGEGRRFAEGKSVKIVCDEHQIPWIGRQLRVKRAGAILILAFGAAYLFFVGFSLGRILWHIVLRSVAG